MNTYAEGGRQIPLVSRIVVGQNKAQGHASADPLGTPRVLELGESLDVLKFSLVSAFWFENEET